MNVLRIYETPHSDRQIGYQGPWPPPEFINFEGVVYERRSYSQLPDDVADHPNLMRGAVYRHSDDLDDGS